jgi:hypothetical protein
MFGSVWVQPALGDRKVEVLPWLLRNWRSRSFLADSPRSWSHLITRVSLRSSYAVESGIYEDWKFWGDDAVVIGARPVKAIILSHRKKYHISQPKFFNVSHLSLWFWRKLEMGRGYVTIIRESSRIWERESREKYEMGRKWIEKWMVKMMVNKKCDRKWKTPRWAWSINKNVRGTKWEIRYETYDQKFYDFSQKNEWICGEEDLMPYKPLWI